MLAYQSEVGHNKKSISMRLQQKEQATFLKGLSLQAAV